MDPGDDSDFSKLLRETLAQQRNITVKPAHAKDGAAHSKMPNPNWSPSPFEQQMFQILANNVKPPSNPTPPIAAKDPEASNGIVELVQSLGIDVSESSAAGLRDADKQRREKEEIEKAAEQAEENEGEIEHYHNFLCKVAVLGTVECIPQSAIRKDARKPYGTGASMTVYPGFWEQRKDDGSTAKKVVAIKYCNITPPQGASSLRDCKNQIWSRLKSVLYELEVMSGRDNRHGNVFPELYAMSWEECQTPAGITIYQPILVVEPAIATLEEYICNGWPHSVVRHEAEQRFIMSLHSAVSYLHEQCGIVHGDLKPANILIFLNQYSGEVYAKLADFGLAFPIFNSRFGSQRRDNQQPLGTRYWSAPEMCLDDRFVFRSALNPYVADYYSFALVVWFVLCGYPVSASGKKITKNDEAEFVAMKEKWGTEVQDHFEEAFKRRWRWKVRDFYIKYLKKEKDARNRKKIMSALIAAKQIEEQEWDEQSQRWITTKSQLHHAYRGLVRMALSWMGDERIYPIALPTSLILERSVSQTLAACHVCGELDYPLFDYKFSADAARRHVEKHLGSQLYARETSERSKEVRSKLMRVDFDSVNSIPQSLGEELMKLLVSRADEETRSKTERIRDMHSIENLSTRFPTDIDPNKLEHQKLEFGSGVRRLKHILSQNLCGETVGNDVAIPWILEGLSSFLTEEVDDKVHATLTTISHDLAERPAQVALMDWASEIGGRETKQPKFERLDKYPIFKSIANGNLPELQHLLAKTKTHPSKLRYEQYDLLNFSIVAKQPKICRYLCLEHDFTFTLKDGGEDAFEACIRDPLITVLGEFDSFSALLHQKWLNETGGDIDRKPVNLGLTLLYPPCFAILVREGTAMAIEFAHSLVSSPLAFTEKMTQLMWIEQFEGEDGLNPLLSALSTRRLTPFMRVLQMGSPHRANFSPNSVLFGMPILFHAIESLAPFFVAALLAYGADVKATVEIFGMSVGPLHLICTPQCIQGYKESLQRRLGFHEDCGFGEGIIKRDRAQIETAEQDAASQRILIADLLISHGVDINARMMIEQEKGTALPTVTIGSLTIPVGPDTPLSLAISLGDTKLACFLITKGADLALPSMANTPLYQAIDHNNVEVVKCLLEHGASLEELREGITPLAYTTCLAWHDIFKLLLQRGADLRFAAATGGILFYQILEMTSELWSDDEAATIAHLSTREDRCKLRPILAEHLKNTSPTDLKRLMQTESENGAIGIHHAARWITGRNEGDVELLQMILGNTENLHATVHTGQNALSIGLALGNLVFLQAWNLAFGVRSFGL